MYIPMEMDPCQNGSHLQNSYLAQQHSCFCNWWAARSLHKANADSEIAFIKISQMDTEPSVFFVSL
jgi:hypothetical protein